MPLVKEQNLIDKIRDNPNMKAIRILTTPNNFEKRFDGSISLFFRTMKNGLNALNGKSNRIIIRYKFNFKYVNWN
jgi:hypothetical protein